MNVVGGFTHDQAEFVVSALIGFMTPWVVAVFNHRGLSDRWRVAVAALVALSGAVLQTFLMGQFTFTSLASAFAVIFPVSQTIYRNVALKLGVRALEVATSGGSPPDEPLPTSSTAEAAAAVERAVETPEGRMAASSRRYNEEDVKRIAENVEKANGKLTE